MVLSWSNRFLISTLYIVWFSECLIISDILCTLHLTLCFLFVRLSLHPTPLSPPSSSSNNSNPSSSRNWALAAAGYGICWLFWIVGIVLLYEIVYSWWRRWRCSELFNCNCLWLVLLLYCMDDKVLSVFHTCFSYCFNRVSLSFCRSFLPRSTPRHFFALPSARFFDTSSSSSLMLVLFC